MRSPSARTRRTRTTSSARAVLARDGRVFEGVNVENAAYPLGVCAEKVGDRRARSSAGCGPATIEAIGITASPCGGCRQWLYEFRLDRVTFRNRRGRGRHATRPRSCCRTRGSWTEPPRARPRGRHARSHRIRHEAVTAHAATSAEYRHRLRGRRACFPTRAGVWTVEERVRRRRRAAERGQVDARERALRRQGRDRLRQAADDPPAHLRDRERRRTTSSCSPTCRASSGRATRSPSACSARSTQSLRGRRRRPARALGARADRRGRPLHRRARLRARRAGRDRAATRSTGSSQATSPSRWQTAAQARRRSMPSIRSARRRATASASCATSSSSCCRKARLLPGRPAHRLSARDAGRRADPREGAPAHARGGAARDLGRGRRARRREVVRATIFVGDRVAEADRGRQGRLDRGRSARARARRSSSCSAARSSSS